MFAYLSVAATLLALALQPLAAQQVSLFPIEETTIARIHEAILAHRVTAKQVVQLYLDRIEAGAIILAKSNLPDFASSAYETVSSVLPGYTRNPYDLYVTTAGSSGGTAAAIAANFGTVGLGTDTGNSIRGPASHLSLVGLRPTLGLVSRDGLVPLDPERDVTGPMTRTVADAAVVLSAIAGDDPSDSMSARSRGHIPPGGYAAHLRANALRGARIGVLRQLSNTPTTDPEVLQRFEEALQAMRGRVPGVSRSSGRISGDAWRERACPEPSGDHRLGEVPPVPRGPVPDVRGGQET